VTAYRFIQENRDRQAVRETAGLFSAYYRWAKNGASVKGSEADAGLV
jgi:hypothetical protein